MVWALGISMIKVKAKVLVTQLCPTLCDPKTVARQAPLSMDFSTKDY